MRISDWSSDVCSSDLQFGRDRHEDDARWGPRTLDLDLLLFGDAVIDEPGLRVPHPYLHERAFALVPLAAIAPGASIPGHGTVRSALAAVVVEGIEALPCSPAIAPPGTHALSTDRKRDVEGKSVEVRVSTGGTGHCKK